MANLVANAYPVRQRHPVRGDIAIDQVQQFAQLAVIALDGIGGIHEPPDIGRIIKHRRQLLPRPLPTPHRHGELPAPAFAQFQQFGFGQFARRRLVHLPQPCHKRFGVILPHIGQALSDVVDHAALYHRAREDRPNRLAEPHQPIDTGDKDILHPARLQVTQDTQPKARAFAAIPHPVPQHVPLTRAGKA